MIGLSAVLAGYESIRRLYEAQPLTNLGWVLTAALLGFAGNELVAVYRIRVGRRIGSAALIADGVHARTDGFTSLAVVLGVIGVWAGFPLADPVVGLLISAVIFILLWGTARDIGRRLLDGVDPALVDRAEQAVRSVPGVKDVQTIRMRWLGHRLSVEATVTSDPAMPVGRFHQLEHQADDLTRRIVPGVAAVRLNPSAHVPANAALTCNAFSLLCCWHVWLERYSVEGQTDDTEGARFMAATGWAPRYPSARESWIATAEALRHP